MIDKDLGLTTATREDGGYMHLDYDNLTQEEAEMDIQLLQEELKLGNVVLVRTTKGHHGIPFWNKMTWDKIMEVLSRARVDEEFKKFRDTGFLRLRVRRRDDKDLRIIKIIRSKYHQEDELGDFNYMTYKRLINHNG